MDEKWEFVPISGEDFYQHEATKKDTNTLFDPQDFTFQDPNPKTPELFRTTEFDRHNLFDDVSLQTNSFPSGTQVSSPTENGPQQIRESFYQPTEQQQLNTVPIQRTSSVPSLSERQSYGYNNVNYGSPPTYYSTSPQYYNPNFTQYVPQSPPPSNQFSHRQENISHNINTHPHQQPRSHPNLNSNTQPQHATLQRRSSSPSESPDRRGRRGPI